ncbi:MAG: hypothetical protein HS126_30170 [Anaerolineales bacterium]|nr:hypothetical protein [Anaerolineales bacterium]
MMNKFWSALKQNFWPISALIFCPCHLPLTMGAVASLTAGTVVGSFISLHYNSIETVLAVAFSFYFVLAFMIWVVRGPQPAKGGACVVDPQGQQRPTGLSTRQIIVWGVIGMFTMPALIAISLFTKQNFADGVIPQIFAVNPEFNSGLIWLISLSTVVMIPVMVIWLVWMWLAWSKTDFSKTETENWGYEYE